jgi:hypothetical protein
MKFVGRRLRLDGFNKSVFEVSSKLTVVLTLLAFVLTGNIITPTNVSQLTKGRIIYVLRAHSLRPFSFLRSSSH